MNGGRAWAERTAGRPGEPEPQAERTSTGEAEPALTPAAVGPLFDALVRDAPLTLADLVTLVRFEVRALVRCAVVPGPGPQEAGTLLASFERLLGTDLPRLGTQGVRGLACLGLGRRAGRLRGAHTVLHRLPRYLQRPEVVAVGEVGLEAGTPPELDLLARQAQLATEAGLPLILQAAGPAHDGPACLARALDRLFAEGFPVERLLVSGVDEENAELAVTCGAMVALTLGQRGAAEDDLELALALPPGQTMLASGLGAGAGDLLALPRALRRLRAVRPVVPAERLSALCGGNARRFFGIDG